eukprot:2804555-Amphidinium_carterae.1
MACNLSAVSFSRTEGWESSGHTSYHIASSGAGMGLASQAQTQARHLLQCKSWTWVRIRCNSTQHPDPSGLGVTRQALANLPSL